MQRYFTSESVTEGHPDKVCDQIADAILDEYIKEDSSSRVACEVAVTTGFVLIMGEITSSANVDVEKVARRTINKIGYNSEKIGFSGDSCEIKILLGKQSADIALGVDNSLEHRLSDVEYDRIGAGDQGMMFGYACDETQNYMPMAIQLAHDLAKKLSYVRKKGILCYLRPDGKTQVSVEYQGDKIKRVDAIVVSTQHDPEISMDTLRKDIKTHVIDEVVPAYLLDDNTKYYINPTGRFVIGGPAGDSGVTGRKIIVDTYGGYAAHGGGSFSGKDPTKVDRTATYFLRYVAKNIVAAGVARRCEIQASYAIGKARPVSVSVNTYGTSLLSEDKIVEVISALFDLRPKAMIDKLELCKPIYLKTASYGHFGRDSFPWEKCDRVADIKKYLEI